MKNLVSTIAGLLGAIFILFYASIFTPSFTCRLVLYVVATVLIIETVFNMVVRK